MTRRILTGCVRLARRFGWGRVFASVLLAALLALRVWDPVPLELLRLKTFDLYQIAKPRQVEDRPAVIVDIDEASLKAHGQWPWPRTQIARLVRRIAEGGAAAIGIDIVFAEPDRTSPRMIAESMPQLSEQARAELRQAPDHDAVLARALEDTRTVLGQSAHTGGGGTGSGSGAGEATFATLGGDPEPYLIAYPGLLANIPVLRKAAKGHGMFTVLPDPDGVVRRVPVVVKAGGAMVPSLDAEMLRLATGQTTYVVRTGEAGIESVMLAGVRIPTDANAQLWLHFSPHDPDRYVSARDVLAGGVPPERFTNKLVLIGTSASGLFDVKATPVEPVMPGVELHAQALENILGKSWLKRPAYAIGAELSLALAVGLAFLVLVPILGALPVAAMGAAFVALLTGLAWFLFSRHGILLDVAYPLLGGLAVFATMVFVNYFREEAQRRQIRSAFGQYLSPDLVEVLARDPGRLVLGGETRELSVLFSDVRGFTSISESYKADPQALTALLNRMLTPLSNAILDHRGTIDKYMGDAIMAFWNAPLDDESHAADACTAALAMLDALDRVNAERKAEAGRAGTAFVPLRIGVGINTGECVVGNMGSDLRFDYSVLGDSVNLASRLEGQSETFGIPVILGSRTAGLVRNDFATLELDVIRVKGKTEPEVVHALLGPESVMQEESFQALKQHTDAMLAAYRKRDWNAAMKALRAGRKVDTSAIGADLAPLFDLYETRIGEFRKTPPPKTWDGVYTLQSK